MPHHGGELCKVTESYPKNEKSPWPEKAIHVISLPYRSLQP